MLGVILSVFCAIMLWRIAFAISNEAVALADMAIEMKDKADMYVAQVEDTLANMQQKVGDLKHYADTVSRDATRNPEVIPLIERLDEELVRELAEVRNTLKAIQSGSDALNQTVKQFEALSSPIRMFSKRDEPKKDSDLAALSNRLTDVSTLVQQVIDFVTRMEQQGITDEQASRMKQAVTRLEESLDAGYARLASLRDSLHAMNHKLVAKRDRVPLWTNGTALLCTVLLVCFSFTQLHLIGHGWRVLIAGQRPTVEDLSKPERGVTIE
jgi:hypothetical protein